MKRYTYLTRLTPWFICGLGALFYAYEYYLRIMPSVMTSDLLRFYHIHTGALGNLSAFYYYIYTPMQLAAGILMDRYGPRRLLTLATLCCVAGSILFASTPILLVAELGRFLIGFGSAFAFVGVLKLATIWLPRRYFAMFSGIATALGMLGAIAGDISLTKLVQWIGWQETAYVSAGLGILLALLIGLFVRDNAAYQRKSHVKKVTVSFHEALNGLWEIIKTPQMWIIGIIGGLFYIPASAFAELWGVPFLETTHGFSSQMAATGVSMVFAGWAIGGPLYGWISDKIRRRILPLVFSGVLSGSVFLLLLFAHGIPPLLICTLLFLFGLVAGGQPIVFALGHEVGPPRLAGSSIAFINMTVMLSGVILQPLIGYILDVLWSGQKAAGLQVFTIANYQIALLLIPAGLFMGAFIAKFLLKETYCRHAGRTQGGTYNDADARLADKYDSYVEQNP